ncbi:protein commissureless 2 [Anastrepha ludens]|uniref:protein commissureless 2 n=1 Tax=Anastrepha ludens TaxID=28586 RepID=UPI0023B1DE9C|nr:protein commissureless 2 [Anastrepha ludens]
MDGLTRSLNFELPHEFPPLDGYAQQILEGSKTSITATPTVSTLDISSTTISPSSEILQRIGATLLNSIQLRKYIKIDNSPGVDSSVGEEKSMDLFRMSPPNHVVIDSSGIDAMDELQRQVEYDKFMNEVWIGIVLTLILISMVFCICSCFLYHQFRTWKSNYHSTVTQSRDTLDNETTKMHPDFEDPVPDYTLVSGLPSYEAALELLNKSPQSCLVVHPSVFSIFHANEKVSNEQQQKPPQSPQSQLVEVTTPLLSQQTTTPAGIVMAGGKAYAVLPTYEEAANVYHNLLGSTNVTLTDVSEKSAAASTEQAKEKHTSLSTSNSVATVTETTTTIAMQPRVATPTASFSEV